VSSTKPKPEAALGKAPTETSRPLATCSSDPSILSESEAKYITEDEVYSSDESDIKTEEAASDKDPKPITAKGAKPSATVNATTVVSSDLGFASKPVRPAKPFSGSRRIRKLKELSTPMVITKPSQRPTKPRRTTEIRPSTVADIEAQHADKTSREVAEIVRVKYELNPFETKTKINQIRTARQARRTFARRIRNEYRLDGTKQTRQQFLKWLEETCRQMEGHDSDEYEF